MAGESLVAPTPARVRPRSLTVFVAAFVAGAAAAVGVNRVLDVHLAQRRPQVECEPIFVALRPLPQGSPVTVWDVALKDWPKAMLPSSALRAGDSFEGFVLRHAVREGQPLLLAQLVRAGEAATGGGAAPAVPAEVFPVPQASQAPQLHASPTTQADPWMPAEASSRHAPPDTTARADSVSIAAVPHDDAPGPTDSRVRTPTAEPAEPAPQSEHASSPPTVAADPVPVEETASAAAATLVGTGDPATEAGETTTLSDADASAADVTAVPPTGTPPVPAGPADVPPSPQAVDPLPTAAGETADGGDDVPAEVVAGDVESLPSVVNQATPQPIAADHPAPRAAGRYLVVPERIAVQADSWFTTPRRQPQGPPAVGSGTKASRPGQQSPATAGGSGRPPIAQRGPSQRTQPHQARRPQPPVPPAPQPQPRRTQAGSGAHDRSVQRTTQPTTTPVAPPQRTWIGMFPAIAAGVESMGGPWQRTKAAPPPGPAPANRAPANRASATRR